MQNPSIAPRALDGLVLGPDVSPGVRIGAPFNRQNSLFRSGLQRMLWSPIEPGAKTFRGHVADQSADQSADRSFFRVSVA
jgi:hypothetical protein